MCSSKFTGGERKMGGIERRGGGEKYHSVQDRKGSTQWLLWARDTLDRVTCFELQSVSKTCAEQGGGSYWSGANVNVMVPHH